MAEEHAKAITVGAIIHLQNGALGGGYLDTYGWVADKPAFWNVAGTERIFVSTHGTSDRGGGTTSWRVVSADGKAEGASLAIGDRIHLLNMYPDAGYLDCCGWIQDLAPFSEYAASVTCGVFTSGASDRDNGTGIWTIRSANSQATGAPLLEGDAIALENGHPGTGALVAYGNVTDDPDFTDFVGQQQFVFTSTDATIQRDNATWTVAVSHLDDRNTGALFDFFRPELLKGRSNNMEAVRNMTTILFRDAFYAIGGIGIDAVEQLIHEENNDQRFSTLLGSATSGTAQHLTDVIDHDFQIKQLLHLYVLDQTLRSFDQNTLYALMADSLKQHQHNKTLAPLNLVRRCFQYLATDYEIIQRAIMQRRWTQNLIDSKYYQSKQAEELLTIDKLAIKAVAPFQHLLQDTGEQLVIITYFSETTHIRRLPYTNQFMLLGVSYDRISPADSTSDQHTLHEPSFSAFELLAIPHEVGHYVYQYGKLNNGQTFPELSRTFEDNPYYRWCEELFADLYGCVVAGPLSVFGMQAFLTSGDTERAWNDDDEHPTPMVRCYMLSEILRVLSDMHTNTPRRYHFDTVIRALDNDWSKVLEAWGCQRVEPGEGRPVRVFLPDIPAHQERIVNIDRMINAIRPIIQTFATALLQSLRDQPLATDIPWSKGDYADSGAYAREMAALTGREMARASIARTSLLAINVHDLNRAAGADKRLKWYLDNWGDRGPTGGGGGTYLLYT